MLKPVVFRSGFAAIAKKAGLAWRPELKIGNWKLEIGNSRRAMKQGFGDVPS
jgi:hypothetical protein